MIHDCAESNSSRKITVQFDDCGPELRGVVPDHQRLVFHCEELDEVGFHMPDVSGLPQSVGALATTYHIDALAG